MTRRQSTTPANHRGVTNAEDFHELLSTIVLRARRVHASVIGVAAYARQAGYLVAWVIYDGTTDAGHLDRWTREHAGATRAALVDMDGFVLHEWGARR